MRHGFPGFLTTVALLLFHSGCITFKSYIPSINPVAPPRNSNSLSAGVGFPLFIEYRQHFNSHFDVMFNGTYGNFDGFLTTFGAGPNFWLMEKEASPGFNMGLYLEPSLSINRDTSLDWSLWGVRLGITPGYYGQSWSFAAPLNIGGGLGLNFGFYYDIGVGIQVNKLFRSSSVGLTINFPMNPDSSSLTGFSGVATDDHTIIFLMATPQLTINYTYFFGRSGRSD